MEDIYSGVPDNQWTEEELSIEIIKQKASGHTIRDISKYLGLSKSKVGRILKARYGENLVKKDLSHVVPKSVLSVPNSIDTPQSVADQPLTIEYIKQHYVNNIELQKLKEHIEEVVNSRLNMGLKQLKDYINEKLKEVKTSP